MMVGCLVIGNGILGLCSRDSDLRMSDRVVLSLWLGLITLSIALMSLSFLLPLSLGISTGSLVLLSLCAISLKATRRDLWKLKQFCSLRGLLGLLSLELIVATLMYRPMVWFDSGLYHLGTLQWLNQFGAVPGVALINGRFGFTSAWFPLSAPFVSEFFGDRIGAVTNGFVFLLAIINVLICGKQLLPRPSLLSDYFGFCFFSFTAIAYSITVFKGAPVLISFSPDITITFMVGMIAWLILIIRHQPTSLTPEKASPSSSKLLNIHLLVLIFAAAALSFKLSAIPLAAIALVFYAVHQQRFTVHRFCRGLFIFIVMIFPMLTFGTITSGCPLYPSRLLCLDLPWTLSAAQSSKALQPIAVLKGENRLPNLLDPQDWIWLIGKRVQLFLISYETRGMMALAALSMLAFGVALFYWKRWQAQGQIWVISLGLLGSLFILSTSPLIRFGLGYFTLIPALIFAMILKQYHGQVAIHTEMVQAFLHLRFVGPYAQLFLLGFCSILLCYAGLQSQLIRLPQLPQVKITSAQINDIAYGYPENYQVKCWNAALPCAPLPIEENIALRMPEKGIAGGFKRLSP